MSTVYAVASSKGGVGKTTTTVNLGATLAAAGLSVVVVDGDIGMANLGGALGVDPDGATLHDVLAGEASVEEATYDGPEGLAVVPGDTSIDGFRAADPANLSNVLAELADYDYVLVDTGAGLSHDTVLPLGLADEVVLVSTTERDSLTDTEKTRQVVERLGGETRGVVLTSVDQDDPNAAEVAERLHADVIEAIPVDPAVRESMRLAEPLSGYAPKSPAASAYRALAESLTGETLPTPEAATEPADDAAVGADDVEAGATGPDDDEEAVDTDPDDDVEEATDADDADAVAEDADDTEDETADVDSDGVTLDSLDHSADDEGVTLTEPEESDSAGDEADDVADEELDEDDDIETGDGAEDEDSDAEDDDSSGLTDDDALAADTTPSDDPLVADSADPAEDDEAEPVFATSLVEEAEPTEETTTGEDDDEESLVETDDEDEERDDDGGKKGFFGRLLG